MKSLLPESYSDVDHSLISDKLGLQTQAAKNALRIALENIILLDKKHLDYGPKNISMWGSFGCLVRMSDKVARLSNLFSKKRRKAVNESVLDSYRDISNYAIISQLFDTNKWPNE